MKNVEFDYTLLQKKIDGVVDSMSVFFLLVGISKVEWQNIMSGESFFKQYQIKEVCSLLAIKSDEIGSYFFKFKIKKT
ncbi:hypothetical protein [Candidatus Enterococcus clewellii]|uniref:Uncharacterized protein n=1 Tax=Candidatus Enterococcus clewellii TaxID=1834193 RepID=A0AAQ3VVZ4_9ENTE